ncbi:Fip1-domain-containing protein [Calocera cornea HHB12733]|uniref:Fip1-domain-containing protein n=1 Tax=Calocera cornea HHB12733 TaxID=1353952 RepID=A0A165CQZ6_9BASI|nr:Fip1-domain-containing protein [Calocera cornea HHB12733]
MDDDDAFLYGDEDEYATSDAPTAAPISQAENDPATQISISNDLNRLPQIANVTLGGQTVPPEVEEEEQPMEHSEDDEAEAEADDAGEEEGEEAQEEDESDEDDLEIILQPQPRSIDFRDPTQQRPVRPPGVSPAKPSSLLTTEYTPRERDASFSMPKSSVTPQPSVSAPATELKSATAEQIQTENRPIPDGPPPRAASNAPEIDPTAPGMLDARSIYDVELQSLAEKPWRRPGSDLSDWFNYGFDEISWEAYCLRKKELSELSAALKQNVIAYTGMPENQLLALPPEMRTMAINSANMANAMPLGVPQTMMGGMAGMPTGDMMGMGGMGMTGIQPMQQNMLGAGMNGDQTMHMPENVTGNMQGAMPGMEGMSSESFLHPYGTMQLGGTATSGMTDGSGPNASQFNAYPAAYNIDTSTPQGEQVFTTRVPARNGAQSGRGTPPVRGSTAPMAMRGRGRGAGFGGSDNLQVLPTRPASPLPPNVPTGPRNRTTYKDKDREPVKQDVEGLDYGGGIVVDSTTNNRKRPFAGEEDNGRSKRR